MSYNTLILDYGNDSHQVRFYSSPILHGKELEEKKMRNKKIKELKQRREEKKHENEQISFNLQNDIDDSSSSSIHRDVLQEKSTRAKNLIYEYCRANTWEYFVTITFDPTYTNSFDYNKVVKKISNKFTTLRRDKAPDLKYIVIPELHKSGRYHFHGLLANTGSMYFVDSGHKTKDGLTIFNMADFSKIGHTTATLVSDTARVSGYICKYITKELEIHLKGKKRYLASHNLNRPERLYLKYDNEERKMLVDSLGEVKHSKSTAGYRKVMYIEV